MLTAHQIDPRADAHLLTRLHHLQRLVQQYFSGEGVVNDLDQSIRKREPSSSRIVLHAYSTTKRQLNHDATTEGVGDVVVPEREVALPTSTRIDAQLMLSYLLILQPQ